MARIDFRTKWKMIFGAILLIFLLSLILAVGILSWVIAQYRNQGNGK